MDLRIFTNNVEGQALNQIYTLAKLPVFENCKIRIMPDVHAGKGCVIGFTADLGEKVIPGVVGVDIGCGMLTVELGQIDINLKKLDEIVHKVVPAGINVHAHTSAVVDTEYLQKLICYPSLIHQEHILASMGTLGGGNHFIEIDQNSKGEKFLVIHTGSRNLGKQVAEIYQQLAIDTLSGKINYRDKLNALIAEYKNAGRQGELQDAIEKFNEEFKAQHPNIPEDLCYLEGIDRENYLHDMKICQKFAVANRATIAEAICKAMGWTPIGSFETIHNYISFKDNIVRKGAISAYKGQKVLIPMNMRDGCIIGVGKGNDEWNQSAPHGAGRIMSRGKAKESIKLEDFQEAMKGIYSTTVTQATIDESPFAYKPMEEIVEGIKDTVEIKDIIKPIYNFKATE